MAERDTLLCWLWLSQRKPLRSAMRRALAEAFGGAAAVYAASDGELSRFRLQPAEYAALRERSLNPARELLRACERRGVRILTPDDAAWPRRLREVPDAPLLLYYIGTWPDIDRECVTAVVGTRKASAYGLHMAEVFGYGLASAGALVATGLAAGIDSAAARGALSAGGRVIGVLGTGIDRIYPPENEALFRSVASAGVLVSEYAPGEKIYRSSFTDRNRIIAGLSVGTLVVEAPARSGALVTARRALEYNRDVFALPGNLDNEAAAGSNLLLGEGAALATSAAGILENYVLLFPQLHPGTPQNGSAADRNPSVPKAACTGPETPVQTLISVPDSAPDTPAAPAGALCASPAAAEPPLPPHTTELQARILRSMTLPAMPVDDIITASGLAAATVLAQLTKLQVRGLVTQQSGKRFTRVR